MDQVRKLQTYGWLIQGVAGCLASLFTTIYGIWSVFALEGTSSVQTTKIAASVVALVSMYYFGSRIKILYSYINNVIAQNLFLKNQYNWATLFWCLTTVAFALILNNVS